MSATKSEAIEGYRLSPQQTRLWHVLQYLPACERARVSLRLQGSPRPLLIERALHLLVSRHSILRTSYFSAQGPGPLQVISPETVVTFDVCDLSGLESEVESSALEQLALEAAFSDTEPEALRVNALFVSFSPHDHHLWINLPSMTADTRSLNNLAREFMRCYESCAKATALPDEPLDYLQFSEWQNELLLDVEQSANGREYWRQFGSDQVRFRQAVSTFKPAVVEVTFTAAEVSQIETYSANASAVWLACWQALLWSTSGTRQVALGCVSEGRRYEEMNDGLGLYAKWLPVTVEMEEERGLHEIVRDASDAMRAADEQQDYFVLEGETEGNRFFANGYEYEERWDGAATVGVHFSVREQQVELEPYELKLHCVKENGQVRAELRYDTEVYEEAEVRKLAGRYQRVVQSWIGNVDVKLGEIGWLSAGEREEIIQQSQGEVRAWGEDDVVKLFEAQVRRSGTATAVSCGAEQVSYEELNRRANQLAHYLRALGVGPEVKVGLLLPRSVAMVVGVLGVLKAGAAYLPLDLQAPLARLAYMLEDAQVPVLLTEETLPAGVPAHWGQTIYLERDWEQISGQSEENPAVEVSAEQLAYLIYTSGSTGRPKGALITRAGLSNYLSWALRSYPLEAGCGSPVHTPLSFDLTVTSLYTPLLSGQTVDLLREAGGAEALVEALQAGRSYSLVKLTPSHLEVLRAQLTAEQAARCSQALVIGGEALYEEQVRWWREQAPGVRLFNEYGPTETVVGCCVSEVEPVGERVGGVVAIGRPISNTQLYVLDERLEVLPVGLVGELYIGGAGVGGGYWERAELTAERYLPDGFSPRGGARLYRTGDAGRYGREGQVEYVGRLDEQVKVRGYRVELGEIEAELRAQGAVREAVVLLRADQTGHKRLVAYVVAEAKTAVSELRQSLQERLPEYMIPSAFVKLEELPLTVNGKVDRRALPAPDSQRPQLEKVYVGPRNQREEKLAGIWSQVLGLEKVGVNDNFFELGGDSIRSIQVVARARQQGMLISTRQLFQYQTIEALASAVSLEDSSAKQGEDLHVHEQQTGAGEELLLNTVPAAEIEGSYPLSPMQQGMLYHAVYAPQSTIYTQQVNCTLKGELNVAAFERAWQEVINRYSVLRTSFLWENRETPMQLVQRQVKLPLEQKDWQHFSPEQQERELEALLVADRARGFELAQSPLMRLFLLHFSPDTYHFIWSRHHILFDGWSLPLVLQEVFAFYEAGCRGETLKLDQPRPFSDYIAWLKQQDMSRAETYWRNALAGFSTPTRLSIERAPNSKTAAEKIHAEQEVRLSAEQNERVQRFAREQQVTVNTVVQGAWALLLSRYSGEDDVLFGATVSGRPAELAGVEQMVGLFINSLPVRVRVSGEAHVGSWLREWQAQAMELRQYEHSSLVDVQGWSEVKRGQNLFESLMVFDSFPAGEGLGQDDAKLQVSNVKGTNGDSSFILTLTAQPGPELLLLIGYDQNRFEAASITRMLGHLETIIEALAANQMQQVWEVPWLTEAEEQQVLKQWNDTNQSFVNGQCVQRMIEEQVERTSEQIALIHDAEQLSYRELNHRANRLAHYLQSQGVGPETLVGLCVERSPEMVVALLAIMKAGGAYVPLDPAYPTPRLQFIIEDAGLRLLITQERVREKLAMHGCTVICLDSDAERWAELPITNPKSTVEPENLAYVIYTSGSTGSPKGVTISHRNLSSYIQSAVSAYSLSTSDRLLQFFSISFDGSVEEIFPTLSCGATLVLRKGQMVSDAASFLRQCEAVGLTVLDIPTAYSREVAQELERGLVQLPASVRLVIVGGEKMPRSWLRGWLRQDGVELVNTYGPTEATIVATRHRIVSSGADELEGEIPIGRPIENAQVYVLDRWMQPVPVGVQGELYIGGQGVSRGYLQRPELTAARFVPDPFGGTEGARLYRTGDLVRYLADGELEFLGRVDEQVKLRGFRIELGEIESVLCDHAAVCEAVVVVREDVAEQKELVGYVVGPDRVASSELREYLKERLPDYMVPSWLVWLTELPLTPNGKLDRRALPAPERVSAEQSEEETGSRSPIEEIVAGLWSELLHVSQLRAGDNFFELGGHSLLATQLVSRLRTVFAVELSLRLLFEFPTVAGQAGAITAALKGGAGVMAPALLPVADRSRLPLSFAQQRLWFLEQMEPGTATYNMPTAIRLLGKLDVAALERSLSEVVRRHEVLRTTFVTVNGEPVQVIAPAQPVRIAVLDLSEMSETECQQAIEDHVAEEAHRPFALNQDPWRVRLLRVGAEDQVLLFTMHHIVSDGWSMDILTREVSALYAAYAAGQESALAELPIQYADYAVWQREWLQGEVLAEQLDYWRKQLAGAPAVLELPADHARPAQQSHRGGHLPFQLPAELTAGLKQLSQREGVTLFMTLLAAWQMLLARYSRQADVVVGSPVANRTRAEVEGLIGFFVNTLVLRTEVAGELRVRELLQRVREVCLGAYAHQEVPFEMLVEQLQPERDLSYTPLFQVLLVLQNAPQQPWVEWAGVGMRALELESGTAKYDLTLGLAESERGLVGTLEYNRDLYERESMERLVGHYQQVLSGLVTQVEQRVWEVRLLSEAERRQLLVEWNDTSQEFPRGESVPELFERQVKRTPEQIAVVYEAEQLSYRELNARANQLAHYLKDRRVRPEVLVGVSLERSLELVVALLGVLKAGAAYVPLDPGYPAERLRFMCEDAGVGILLSRAKLAGVLPEFSGERILLDGQQTLFAQQRESNPQVRIAEENPAYVIYTSGSTGRPKGVVVSHRAICNHMHWMQREFGFTEADRVLQKTPVSFDASVWEFFAPLVAGARLIMAQPEGHGDPSYLVETIRRQQVTVLQLVPSLLRHLLEEPGFASCESLKWVCCGGEELPVELVRNFKAVHGGELVNLYGPTEAAIDSVYEVCRGGEAAVAIGRPIANVEVYVLDERQEPVPVGVPGELYVGGTGLARGYQQQAGLTGERFVPHPHSGEAGARLYRTGDLVRWQADGRLLFCGRVDEQVKVRGHRIELGEIESVLCDHAAVCEAVVVVREDVAEQKELVGYVVGPDRVASSELREYLKERLPDYMVPSWLVWLTELPLTPNGKLDRRALPAPERVSSEQSEEETGGRSPIEEIVAGLWSELLHVSQLRAGDNFFELGGHSLLATQLVSRLRTAFAVELSLRLLFEFPTVAGQAGAIEAALKGGAGVMAPSLLPVADRTRLPLSFAQQRLWFLEQMEPGTATYNIPLGIRLSGQLEVAALERSLSEVVRRHEVLRTTFVTEAGRARQVIAAAEPVQLPVTELGGLAAAEQEAETMRLANEAARRPFDLARGALWRGQLLRLSATEQVLLFTMHHIVSDGWSMDILTREVSALYAAYAAGQESALAELPIQYADYAVWQREWLQGEVLAEQLGYWRKQLAGAPAVLELPADHARPAQQSHRGGHLPFQLSAELMAGLKQLSQREGVTLFMTLLAAWQMLLARYSRQADVVVGSPVANRTRAEVEGLIGFFVNTLVLRTEVAGELRVRELLQRVREVCLGAYAHQEVPFEMLVEQLQPERDLSYTPLFQVLLVLQNAPQQPWVEWAGVGMRALELESGTAKYDLTLGLAESERGLVGTLEYNRDLYERESMERLVGHYQQVLSGLVGPVEQRVWEVRLLSEAEQAQVLRPGQERRTEYEVGASLTELFERQVEQRPEATALRWEEREVSYGELNRRANQLGHYLRRQGVGPEVLVALVLERSVELVMAVLGVLKAGGAYLPVDPAYPGERVRFMLADAGAAVVLTSGTEFEGDDIHRARVVRWDEAWPEIAAEPETNLESGTTADNLAYVIYTSGSTGRPKGMMITHRNVLRLFASSEQYFHFNSDDVWSLFHSYAFDFSVWELWGALLYGGQLLLVKYWESRSPAAFLEQLREAGVTVLNQTPSAFRQLQVAEAAADGASSLQLRVVIFGGEALELSSLKPWVERHGTKLPQLVNMYGITETTVHVTYRRLQASEIEQDCGKVIGAALGDLVVYVLDERMQVLPVGVAGEMYVGGGGLGRGYLGRPELTATRFVPDPYSGEAGARLYRTGDVGRYRSAGELEYVGRADEQVKLRGHRIELGEIESVLQQQEGVREAVVLVRGAGEQQQLVGYVVVAAGATVTSSELREQLERRLPAYMVPQAFVTLAQWPLTVHGKLDRKALPEPDGSRPALEKEYVAPRTAVEEVLAGIWSEVLGIEPPSIHDTFFQLGGDSIRSIQVLARARAAGFQLSVQQLFQHPTIYELAQTQLAAEPEQLAAGPLPAFSLLSTADRAALAAGVVDAYPLTRLQAGMLFHGAYDPEAAVYHDILSFHLRAPLELPALRQALAEVAVRHPILRSSFDFVNYSEPLQLVQEQVSVPLAVADLSELSELEQEAALEAWRAEEKRRPFAWGQAPLLRFQLHRRSADSFQFTLSCHHAILDGWSVATLFTELFQETFRLMGLGSAERVTAPASGYNKFVALERETLESAAAQRYWAGQLSELTRTRLPREPPATDNHLAQGQAQGLRLLDHEVRLGGELSAGLRQLARAAGVPLKSVLLAAHLRVLSRFSGQRDVLTGLVSNGRVEETDGERVLGLFLNTVPLRLQLEGGTWHDLLQQTFRAEQGVLPYRRYPLAELQRLAGGGEPLFETAFNYTHFHVYEQLSDVKNVAVLGVNNYALSNIQLTANFSQVLSPPHVQLLLSGNAALLSETQLAALAGCYERCLAAMVQEPTKEYGGQGLLTEAEQQQLLVEWNQTQHEYPRDESVVELFERQVARTPAARALWYGGAELSYAELDRRANQLGHYLQRLGAGPEVLVGIMLERSFELVVAVLGVLKAGAAYLPLEPQQPAARLRQLLADGGVSVLLTHSSLNDQVAEQHVTVVCLDEQWEQLSGERESVPSRAVSAEQLLYVMYTSGSTGQPKGVMIEQGGVSNYLAWMSAQYPVQMGDRILQTTSIGFDVSVRELFWPLLSGAQVVLPLSGEQQDSRRLVELIVEQQITQARLVPALLELFLAEPQVAECRSLQRVFCGGESLPRRLQERFQERLPWAELHNTYGPTEATINATAWQCEADDARSLVPIGRPLWNTEVYLLDEWQQPAPVGVPGELYLGGAGLARGYHQQAGLTAERFVPHPFSAEAGARLYRTGDVGRYRPGGELEFVGRVDEQVKLRGFRIELGEIETVLRQHEQVREAVVVVREADEQKQLVGYVIAPAGETITSSELRQYLSERLPDYMVPQAFVTLAEWPLTVNGKLDRRALPAPEGNRLRAGQAYAAPRTAAEQLLAELWAEVLRLETVGIHDNFFELGGDSILSIQIVARARRGQLYLTPRDLFQHQTIAELAAVAGSQSASAEQGEVTGALPLTPIQHWFFAQQLPEPGHFNQAVLLGLRQRLEAQWLAPLLAALLAQHDALRLRFRYQAGEWRQRQVSLAESLPAPLSISDLSALGEPELAAAIAAEAETQQRRLELEQGPLLRLVLFELGAERGQRLLLIVHHLVVDGVSWRILWEDFQRGYEQLAQGQAVDLGPKTTSYRQWAASLVDYAQSAVVRKQLGYWEQLLQAGAPPLPVNHPQGANLVQDLQSVSRRLSIAETRRLLTEVPALYHTQIQEVLLTALAGAVQRWSGAERVLVNVEGHGREALSGAAVEADLTRTVGWFTTIYPVLLAAPLGAPIGKRLQAIKEQLRGVPERGLGYSLLKYLGGELQGLAEAELSFNYLGQLDQVVSERGWLSGASESSGTARSPLGSRRYLVEVNGFVAANQLQINWNYSAARHDAAVMERVADYYCAELRTLLAHCRQPEAGGYTPSDFPLAPLSQSQLDELLQQYPRLVDLYPLTPTQQGMLFNTLYQPESQMGIEQMHCRLAGGLELAALKHAWQQVLARHAVLRTAFVWEGLPQMLQLVQAEVELSWVYHDWRDLAPEQQQSQFEAFLAADRARGFDPTVAPLLRCTLLQLADELYYFVWSYHHLLFDGWSLPLLLQELFAGYDAYRRQVEAVLPPVRPYRDYLAWLSQQELAAAESYWRTQLAGFTTPTPLPERPRTRPAEATGFATAHQQLSAAASTSLQQFARGQQLTLNTVVQAAWALLLSRYSGADDLLYGVTVSGRPPELPGIEQIVGLFINTLPLRVRLERRLDFSHWLQQLQQRQVELRRFEYSPLVQVQGWSAVDRRRPLFESNLVFENYPAELTQRQQHELQISELQLVDPPHFPLTVLVAPGPQLNLTLEYSQQRFDTLTMARFLQHFALLLEALPLTPDWSLLDLPLLDDHEPDQSTLFNPLPAYHQDQFAFELS